MKKFLFFILITSCSLFANNLSYILGSRNSRFALIGIEASNFGFAIENSIFIQDIDLQYARAILYYNFNLTSNIYGSYALFSGLRYNKDYLDVGSTGKINLDIWKHRINFSSSIQALYDSDFKNHFCYMFEFLIKPLEDIGFYFGTKNIPEFRLPEKRFFGGLNISMKKICLKPEISTPVNGDLELTRFSVNFLYRNSIF